MNLKKSIQRKAVVLMTIIMIITGSIVGSVIFLTVDAGQNDKIALQLNETALRHASDINKHMIEAETAVKSVYALANEVVISPYDMKDPETRNSVKKSVNTVFKGIANDSESVVAYYMTFDPELINARDGIFYSKDMNGTLQENEITDIASYDPDDVEHIGWYTIPKRAGQAVWMEPYYNKNIDRWLISYVIPFYKSGRLVAVIGIDFGFKEIVNDINQIRFLDSGYAFLKSADGSVHYHDEFFEGESHGDELNNIPPKDQELFRSGETNDQTITYTYNGEKWVGVLTTLENGMVLFMVDTYGEVFHDRNMMLIAVVITAIIATMMAIIVAYLASKRVAVPVKQLTDAITQMENGNYEVELPPETEDEIGILSKGIRLLADTLIEQRKFNESAIAERNRKLEIAIIEAQNANRAKTAFLSNMSHDIRTPMNAILGLSAMTKKHINEKDKILYYVDQITVAGNQLLSLINNVLEISRIESNKVDIEEENTDTEEVYNSLLTVFNNQARAKNLSLRFDNQFKHRWVFMDRTHVEEIIINLVTNAMKYTQDGGQINITFESLPGADDAHIIGRTTVKDNGIGMSEEYQKKLFQSFERERNSTVSKIQGTGLGLSIVKKLIDLMGGTITVNSVQGLGTSMIVEIPHRIGEAPAVLAKELPAQGTVDFTGKRILLAEDNDINAMIAEELLSENGILVERAVNGQDCVDKLTERKSDYYDLILMDLQMPIMDGYQATAIIRHLDNRAKARIPIVAMTANAFREDRIRVMDAGMNAHLAKPLDIPQIIATLSRIITYKNYFINTDELNEFKDKYVQLGCKCGYFIYRDDKDETVIFSDAVTEEIYGCESEDEFMKYIDSSFKKMVHPDDLEDIEAKIKSQQDESDNDIDNITYRIVRKDGEIRKVRDIGYKTYNGKEMLFYVYVADVTDLTE